MNHITVYTKPDLKYVQSKLAKFMRNPGPNHWSALKHALRYVKGTETEGRMNGCSIVLMLASLDGPTQVIKIVQIRLKAL